MTDLDKLIIDRIIDEYNYASEVEKPFNSAHEAYAVILEELDELWDEIKLKRENRDRILMEDEAIQIAAMAMRFIVDVCR